MAEERQGGHYLDETIADICEPSLFPTPASFFQRSSVDAFAEQDGASDNSLAR
jgi:hypothetical protein